MQWAFELELRPAALKFLLVSLADNASGEGVAYPSVAALMQKTCLDRKTVISGLGRLEEMGLLADTGQRVGKTNQVKVYRLVGLDCGQRHYLYRITNPATGEFYIGVRTCTGDPIADTAYMGTGSWPLAMLRERVALSKVVLESATSRELANLRETELIMEHGDNPLCRNVVKGFQKRDVSQKRDGTAIPPKSPVFPTEESRFSVVTVPKTGHGTLREPKEEPSEGTSDTSSCELDKRTQVDTLSDVYRVFGHWQTIWNHPKAVLDPKRRARIRARLKDFSVEQLCDAISGFKYSPWHTGTDPRGGGVVYDGIEVLLRDAAQVEKGIGLLRSPPVAPTELSPIDRIRLANGLPTEHSNARVIAEYGSSGRGLDSLGGDVRREPGAGFRKIGA